MAIMFKIQNTHFKLERPRNQQRSLKVHQASGGGRHMTINVGGP